jgi:hypothetical protein
MQKNTTETYNIAVFCTDTLTWNTIATVSNNSHINPLNAKLNPICHLLALLGAHPILHVSRIRVNIHMAHFFGTLKHTIPTASFGD